MATGNDIDHLVRSLPRRRVPEARLRQFVIANHEDAPMTSNPTLSAVEAAAAAIRALGAVHNPDVLKATYAIFTPLQERAARDGVRRHLDVAYGEDERDRLDIVAPDPAVQDAPVVVYFHGGALIRGERNPKPGLIYENVATFFARSGCIGVNATYRLAPQHTWPSGAQDVGRVVAWLQDHVREYGGDPSKIILIGQSAGASHVAAWSFLEAVHGPAGPRIAGAILLSGVYAVQHPEFSPGEPAAHQQAYYGADAGAWASMATLGHVRAGHPPVMLGVSEFDPYPYAWGTVALARELLACDRRVPWMRTFAGHNHVSPAMSINSDADTVGPDLLQFVRQVTL